MPPSATNQSTFQLLHNLTNGHWTIAYEALLDLTGEFRKDNIREDAGDDILLHTTKLSLTVNGHVDKADHLSTLVDLLDEPSKLGPLSVIFLLAGNQKKNSSSIPRSLFGHDAVEIDLLSQWSTKLKIGDTKLSFFQEPLGADDMRPIRGNSFLLGSRRDNQKSTKEYFGNAASFASEQNEVWFNMKTIEGRAHMKNIPSYCENEKADEFRRFVRNRCIRQTKTSNLSSNITIEPIEENNATGSGDTLVQHILSKCLLGSDPDEMMLRREDGVPRTRLIRLICQEEDISVEHRRFFANRTARVFLRMKTADILNTNGRVEDRVIDLIARATASGTIYQDILSFSEAYGSFSRGRALRAVTDFTFEICRDYFTRLLLTLEDGHISVDNIPWELLNVAESCMEDFLILASILCSFEKTDGSACSLINIAVNAARERSSNEMVQTLLVRIVATYIEIIWDWYFEGSSVRDSRKECFSTVLGALVSGSELLSDERNLQNYKDELVGVYPNILNYEDALFLLRAGRSRSLLRLFEIHDETSDHREYLETLTAISLRDFSKDIVRHQYNSASVLAITEKEDRDCPYSKNQSIEQRNTKSNPYFLQKINQCQHLWSPTCDSPSPFRIQDFDEEERSSKRATTKLFTSAICASDEVNVEMKKNHNSDLTQGRRKQLPENILAAGVIPYLRSIDISVQRRILDCYVEKLQLFDHLRNLHAHALLGAGDFGIILIEQIEDTTRVSEVNERYMENRSKTSSTTATFYGASGTVNRRVRDRTRLQRCFRTAINIHTSDADVFADLMSLDAKPKEGPSTNTGNGLWDYSMSLRYEVGFPLDVIISENAMSCYSKIFDFFLRILRAKQSLRNLYMLSRKSSVVRSAVGKGLLHDKQLQVRLWHFCYQAEHFVSIFGVFEMDQVLGSAWDSFESSWQTSGSIWELRDLHTQFLEGSLRRCLLSEKHSNVLNVMTGGFEIVVTVDMELQKLLVQQSKLNPATNNGFVDLVTSATLSLKRRASFLIDVLERLLQSGSLPHLHDLLTRVNFNRYFESSK